VDYRHFYPGSPFEFWGKVNFMKVAIECADLINTVSETYAAEIQTSAEYGYGLEGVLRHHREDLYGIVNGIDYGEWNPETDPLIPGHYSAADLSGKTVCKSELLGTLGLPQPAGRIPLIGIVSRLVDQKGMDLIADSIEQIAKLDLQLVVLGTGQQKYHDMLEGMARRYPHKISVNLAFDNRLAHQIEAGSDIFLMPSKYEPCGLNQLYSLRYGTVPVVRATGGLADTVADYDPASASGTGFRFEKYSASDMMIALMRALMTYSDAGRWRELMLRGMAQDWSWEESARKYLKLYRLIRQKRTSTGLAK
jgi:starch synthase